MESLSDIANRTIPVWFKKLPQTEESKPNAKLLRELGELNGEAVCEILYASDKWIVRKSEVLLSDGALAESATRTKAQIDAQREPCQTMEKLAAKCGISVGTLRKRLLFIQNHLPKESPPNITEIASYPGIDG